MDIPPIISFEDRCEHVDRYTASTVNEEQALEYSIPSLPAESLVILRNFGTSQNDQQIYVPTRYLHGVLPQPLLDEYRYTEPI